MANAVTFNKSIGTDAITVVVPPSGQLADITIQNLSGNNLYWGAAGGLTASTGMKVTPNGSVDIPKRLTPVSVIADGASSDIRIDVEFYKVGEK